MTTSADIEANGNLVQEAFDVLAVLTNLNNQDFKLNNQDTKYPAEATKYITMINKNLDRVGALETMSFEEILDGEEIDEEAYNAYNKKLESSYTGLKICVWRAKGFLSNVK